MKQSKVYCPGAISLIFRPWPNKNLSKMGSTGVGFTVNKGVITTISKANNTKVAFNNKKIIFPTISSVVKSLTNQSVLINIKSQLPLGVGFGISGACALSTAHGISSLFSLEKTNDELTHIAHVAEIQNQTGLGTIGTLARGGFLIKTKPGIPVIAQSRSDLIGKRIFSVVFGKLTTNSVLGNKHSINNINKAADEVLNLFENKHCSFSEILHLSKMFAEKSGILQESAKNALVHVKRCGGAATMHMLGNAIVANSMKGLDGFKNIFSLKITDEKVKVL